MHLNSPFVALFLVLRPLIFLTSIAAIFDEITASNAVLHFDIINCGDATGSAYFIFCPLPIQLLLQLF
jgi:hypothetical protein